jgi:Xanthomonas XOO_2897-like deaminase
MFLIRLAMAVLLAAVALSLSTAATARADYILVPVDFGAPPNVANGLPWDAALQRQFKGLSPRQNMGIFRYVLPDGREGLFAAESMKYPKGGEAPGWPQGHSEWRAIKTLGRWKVADYVVEGYSDLEPCSLPGSYCKRNLRTHFPRLERMYYAFEYGDTRDSRQAGVRALERAATDLGNRYKAASPIMNPPGGGSGGGAFQRLFALPPGGGGFGGIDFSSLELRYVSDDGSGARGMKYAFRGAPGVTPDPSAGLATAKQSSDAFFTWLALPPQTFWVNLIIDQPDRIIDPQLARTDAGRIMLESDLLLKRTAGQVMNPDTPSGDAYWDEVEALFPNEPWMACLDHRIWIAPQQATVRETGDELYILDAPLTVLMESHQMTDPQNANPDCPPRDEATTDRMEDAYRRHLLPGMIQAVNTAPEYAPLRRVYLARVAAEWFRQRAGEKPTAVNRVINSGNVDRWALPPGAWNPLDVFNRYAHSYRNGDFSTTRSGRVNGQDYTWPMVFGGVDFSRTPRKSVSKAEFREKWPKLERRVRTAHRRPARRGGEVWLGGETARQSARLPHPKPARRSSRRSDRTERTDLDRRRPQTRAPRQPEACGAGAHAGSAC